MSFAGNAARKVNEFVHGGGENRAKALGMFDPLGYAISRDEHKGQEKLDARAAELEAQQAADAAQASLGPQSMGVRPQEPGNSVSAGGVAGNSLFANRRPRGAARRSVTGY